MTKFCLIVVCVASALVLLRPAVSRAEVTKDSSGQIVFLARDASGRVQRQVTVNADGSRHLTSTQYWLQARVARRTVDEDLDLSGRTIQRIVQEFDSRGRSIERCTVSIDAAGKKHGTLTRYTYDTGGHASEATSPLGRQATTAPSLEW
jgi:YD repeat-containing protein